MARWQSSFLFFIYFAGKCFQFPLQVNRIPAFIQRKRKPDLAGVKDEDAESLKSSRDPETHITYTSSGNSDIESPPAVPFMNLHPPTPNPTPPLLSPVGECSLDVSTSNDPFERQSLPPKPTSLTDVSRMSPQAAEEAESLLEETQTPTSKPGNMLYIPELRGRLTSAASESSLFNYRNKPQWLDTASVDFKGSAVLTSPGINMQQLVQPRKTEKVAQVWFPLLRLFSFRPSFCAASALFDRTCQMDLRAQFHAQIQEAVFDYAG